MAAGLRHRRSHLRRAAIRPRFAGLEAEPDQTAAPVVESLSRSELGPQSVRYGGRACCARADPG